MNRYLRIHLILAIMLPLFALCVYYGAVAGSIFSCNPGSRSRSVNHERIHVIADNSNYPQAMSELMSASRSKYSKDPL